MPRDALGELELLVMVSVLRMGDQAYAARIGRDLAASTGRRIAAATIHVTLVRLEKKGFLESLMEDGTPIRGGRTRRVFRLTELGAEAVRTTQRSLIALLESVAEHPLLRSSDR